MSWRTADNYTTQNQMDVQKEAERLEKFAKRQAALTKDTAALSAVLAVGLWVACDNNFVAVSYLLGAGLGLAFLYGLGKFMGGPIESTETIRGANIGQTRIAVLFLLYTLVGNFDGLLVIPSFMGFFTYQLAALNRLRAMDDGGEDPSMALMRDLL